MSTGDDRPLVPRSRQLVGGVIFFLAGLGGTFWIWQHALTTGEVYRYAAMAFPAFGVAGLGLILFPGYAEERASRGEDISQLSGLQLLTPRWWVILVLAIAAGAANYALLVRG